MKSCIVFAALIAVSAAGVLISQPLQYAQTLHHVSAPLITVPQSRFTRTDWSQPTQVAIPTVRQYLVQNPGYTTLHQAAPQYVQQVVAAPQLLHAPLVQQQLVHAPLVQQRLIAAPQLLTSSHLTHLGGAITSEITQTVDINKKA